MSLLERFAVQSEFATMPMDEKLLATLYVAILGMGITFLVLVFLQYCIVLMSALLTPKKKETVAVKETNVTLEKPIPAEFEVEQEDEEELIAVLTAAVAACLARPIDQIVVRNVIRVQEGSPNWAKAGLIEQMSVRRTY